MRGLGLRLALGGWARQSVGLHQARGTAILFDDAASARLRPTCHGSFDRLCRIALTRKPLAKRLALWCGAGNVVG